MPRLITPPLVNQPPEPAPNRKKWTRKDCEFLVNSELLIGRYELIDGEVISKMGQKPPHSFVIMRLNAWLVATFGAAFVRIQSPIDVADADNESNEPEPDAVVLSLPDVEYANRQPGPSDCVLVIEVGDTSLQFDLRTKAALYSRAGTPEYWVLDIVGRRLVVHRDPTAEGFRTLLEYAETEIVSPLASADSSVNVADLLPPSQP